MISNNESEVYTMSKLENDILYKYIMSRLSGSKSGSGGGGITPSGTKNITANGNHNVATFEYANVNVPDTSTEIVTRAVVNYSNDDIQGIGGYAFATCPQLESCSCNSATIIGSGAFENCTSLKNLMLNSAKTIGSYAFAGCTSLQDCTLDSATVIGMKTFKYS